MANQEEGRIARWLNFLPWILGLLVLGLMGWGFLEGASSLVRLLLRPDSPENASIALSAGFVRPRAQVEALAAPTEAASPVPEPEATEAAAPSGAEPAAPSGNPAADVKAKKSEPPLVFEIRGSVQQAGQPVRHGKVKLTVSLVGQRFSQSTLTGLDANGEFRVYDDPAFQLLKRKNRIRVMAEAWPAGRKGAGPLTETVYLNHPLPSWLRSSTGYGVLAAVLFFAVFFLWAFTGRSTYGKNRLAIVLSYSVIFLSLAGAVVGPTLLMLAAPDLPEISGKVPVGLVVARLTEKSNPEWMLNLGGYVEKGSPVTNSASSGSGEDEDLVEPVLRVVTLNGGIQIPLYVILLALIGGAINMTRQVPDFQSRQPVQRGFFDSMPWSRSLPPPAKGEQDEKKQDDSEKENGAWRKGLLEQYMFLIAAPFLAIATYYLLILLGTVQPPIIVLVCFSIGLISDTVVTAITETAKKLLGGKKTEPAGQPSQVQPAAKPGKPVEEASNVAELNPETKKAA